MARSTLPLAKSAHCRWYESRGEGFHSYTPFHPLKGRSFEVLAVRNNWGGDRVSYLSPEGRLRTLPLEWTDVHQPDLLTTIGAGRALFRTDRLRQLRRLVDEQMALKERTGC